MALSCLMLDLKSYYPSPAYQLGLLVAYATKEPEVKANMSFSFQEFARTRAAAEIADSILSSKPDVVCASNYAWNYKKICDVLDLLVASGNKLPRILLGGPNSPGSFGAKMMEKYSAISAMVEGEGEPAFRDICMSLVDSPERNPFLSARNCAYRDENGQIVRPNIGHRIQFLDEVPSPYLSGILPAAPSPIFYETNRGCPYRCSFCYWGNGNSKVYRMSLERVEEEMEFFASNNVSSFWIADANFGIFPTDSEIAEMMARINERHRYPFKNVGVNWAKNSSDRVLEIAGIFKKGRMACTTTLAIQSVTSEAEHKSNRYSMPPSKFANLMTTAYERNLDTYTDIIWGLPGENIDEHLTGLDSVITTGVPAILIHQLYLLPGTEFYDKRQELGLVMLSEAGGTTVDPAERSDYWDYIVVSHPKMSPDDMKRGARILGVNHLLHNHDLGRVVDFYLSRYGISHPMVYNFLDDVLMGRIENCPKQNNEFFNKTQGLILEFANKVGIDEFLFYRRLSDLVWYNKESGPSKFREPEARAFMHDFYEALCRKYDICKEPWEQEVLRNLIDYNVLISPKPAWTPKASHAFTYDVHQVVLDMFAQVHQPDEVSSGAGNKVDPQAWPERARRVRERVAAFLTDEYLASQQKAVSYTVKNPWFIPPSQGNADWLLSSRSKHCVIKGTTELQAAVA